MKAITYDRYGAPDVLQITEIPTPVPKDNEILIRIHAVTVTSGDCRVRSLNVPTGFGFMARLMLGFNKPKQPILGTELSGTVELAGKAVTRFKIGDRVFAFSGLGMGCHAEYRCMTENGNVAHMPIGLTFEEAAAISFGGTTALDFLRKGKLKSGESILINGASGGVGTAAIQLAKHQGAEVTAVCSAANADLVRSLGADHVIDYTREDFTRNGRKYDMIMDNSGTAQFDRVKGSLKNGGRLLQVLGGLPDLLRSPWINMTTDKNVISGTAVVKPDDLRTLAQLAAEGKFRPHIDRSFPFEQIADAHGYVDTGRKRGNVVVTLGHLVTTKGPSLGVKDRTLKTP